MSKISGICRKAALVAVALLSFSLISNAQTEKAPARVMFWFDTEDYTSLTSNDALLQLATLLTEEGITAQFVIAGQVCKFLMDNKRYDVIEALKPHIIGTQTLYHSMHPTLTEMTDLEDYDKAYALAYAEESECAGMIKAVLGVDQLVVSDWPGNGASYVADDVMSDMGVLFHGDSGAFEGASDAVWYQNRLHIPYWSAFGLDYLLPSKDGQRDVEKEIDRLAEQKLVCLYHHPHLAVRQEHWDLRYFEGGNLVKFGDWVPGTPVPAEETALFYKRLRAFIRRIKADPRFEVIDANQLRASLKPRQNITLADIPAIKASLENQLGPVSTPASWCVADCFQAAVKMLMGETEVAPGRVYGFLDAPKGVSKPVTVKAKDLRKAASELDMSRHLPTSIKVGRRQIGPADFMFAAFEVLETGASKVRIQPREQLGDIAGVCPALAEFSQLGWIYTPDFKDNYLSNRLRLQFWTMRNE